MIPLQRILLSVIGLAILGLACPTRSFAAERTRVAFLNPGGQGDAFFQPMTDFMSAAADDLGFELIVYYANRNHVLYDENIHLLFSTPPLPDYVIGMNARGSGKELLRLAEFAGVKTIFINQGFIGLDKAIVGKPGQKYRQWLFEYVPDDVNAGYLLAKALLDEAVKRSGNDSTEMLAIAGHEKSVASILRLRGLEKALLEYPEVQLHQVLYADWERDKAHTLMLRLLERYPFADVVWSASDVMAHGVCEALYETGRLPGRDVLVGGVDWAESAIESVQRQELTASIGGHFMDGGWALVMLYDMIHGVPVDRLGHSSFSVLTSDNAEVYMRIKEQNWKSVDFRRFSKYLNPGIDHYKFGLEAVINQLP